MGSYIVLRDNWRKASTKYLRLDECSGVRRGPSLRCGLRRERSGRSQLASWRFGPGRRGCLPRNAFNHLNWKVSWSLTSIPLEFPIFLGPFLVFLEKDYIRCSDLNTLSGIEQTDITFHN